jgi:hypothetical protein
MVTDAAARTGVQLRMPGSVLESRGESILASAEGTHRCFLPIAAKSQTMLLTFWLTSTPPFSAKPRVAAAAATRKQRERNPKMSKSKKPPAEPFRRTQVVSPVPSGRRFGKAKFEKKSFDVYVSDIETGDETLAMSVFAPTQREAIQLAKKQLQSSALLRKITYAAFTAVEIDR